MQTEKDQVAALLNHFDKTTDLELLKKALALLESASAREAASPSAAAEKTRLFMAIFNSIDGKTIPDFNFADLPPISTAPPFETGLPAGVSSDAIEDPALRAKYETELATNREKVKRHNLQVGLRKLDRDTLAAFDRYVSSRYRKSDEKALESLIDQVVHSKPRASALRLHLSTTLETRH